MKPGRSTLIIQICLFTFATADTVEFWPEKPRFVLISVRAGDGQVPSGEFLNGRSQHWDVSYLDMPRLFRSSMLDRLSSYVEGFEISKFVAEMRFDGKVVASAEFRISDRDLVSISNWFSPEHLVATFPFGIGNIKFSDINIVGHRIGSYNRSFFIHGPHLHCYSDYGLMGIAESGSDKCNWASGGKSPPIMFYAKSNGTYNSTVAYADQFLVYIE